MPELPDLQAFSNNLNKLLKGKIVEKVVVTYAKKINVSEAEVNKALQQQKVKELCRDGKELYFLFDNKNILSLHFMLHGELHYDEAKSTHKYTILQIQFTDGAELVLTDFQKQARTTLNPAPADGIDALAKEVNASFLKDQLQKSKSSIKNFLLDQHIIRGIGNAYSDEILWDAGISPFSVCNKIPQDKVEVLAKSIKDVLKNAEKQILKHHPDIISGEVRDFLNIHQPKKEQSPKGEQILISKTGSRKTYYTEQQQLYK